MTIDIPTTAQIRTGYAYLPNASCAMHLSKAEADKFDRWLLIHDAQVAAHAVMDRAELADEVQKLLNHVSYLSERNADIRADQTRKIAGAIRHQAPFRPDDPEDANFQAGLEVAARIAEEGR